MYSPTKQHIHFVGIGGIGMSGIATILQAQGYRISGCDLDCNQKSVHDLAALGCTIYHGNNTPGCHDPSITIVVYSSAIQPNTPEIQTALARGIPVIQRATMLAELMRMKYSIAVAGSHGKTTTTSMISHILLEAKLDPTIIVGGHLKNLSTHARHGNGDLLVAEADESDKSFLKLSPTVAVVTNIDLEHLDMYKDLDDISAHFQAFLEKIPFYGTALICDDDPIARKLPRSSERRWITYGTSEHADISIRDYTIGTHYSIGTLWRKGDHAPLGALYLTMPGKHNLLNATAAAAVALELGVPFATITHALANFLGVDRRFSARGTWNGAELFDDYGHHPTEIDCTLKVASARTRGRLIVAFQPHRYTRTAALWNEFIQVLSRHQIAHLFVTDVYAASEQPIAQVTGEKLAHALSDAHVPTTYVPAERTWETLRTELAEYVQPNDLVLFLGAGSVHKAIEYLHNNE